MENFPRGKMKAQLSPALCWSSSCLPWDSAHEHREQRPAQSHQGLILPRSFSAGRAVVTVGLGPPKEILLPTTGVTSVVSALNNMRYLRRPARRSLLQK